MVCLFTYLVVQYFFSGEEKEVDFLQLIQTPIHSDTIKFTTGFDGFPAFQLLPETDIRSPARNVLPGIYTDFTILVTTKPLNENGGFLFSILTPDDTIMQLGLSALSSSAGRTNITLYVTDYLRQATSVPIATFDVPSYTNEWTRFSLKVGKFMNLKLENFNSFLKLPQRKSFFQLKFLFLLNYYFQINILKIILNSTPGSTLGFVV